MRATPSATTVRATARVATGKPESASRTAGEGSYAPSTRTTCPLASRRSSAASTAAGSPTAAIASGPASSANPVARPGAFGRLADRGRERGQRRRGRAFAPLAHEGREDESVGDGGDEAEAGRHDFGAGLGDRTDERGDDGASAEREGEFRRASEVDAAFRPEAAVADHRVAGVTDVGDADADRLVRPQAGLEVVERERIQPMAGRGAPDQALIDERAPLGMVRRERVRRTGRWR